MTNAHRKLSDHAAAIIENLGEDGIQPTPAEVIELNALCWDVESPEMRVMLSRGTPVRCGDAWLWPLTLAAHVWYQEMGLSLPSEKLRRCALGYAMAYGGKVGSFDALWNERCAEKAVRRWIKTLHVRLGTLDECMAQIQAQDEWPDSKPPKDEAREPPSPGEYSALVASMTGIKPSEIECGMSFHYAQVLFDQARQVAQGDGERLPVRYLAAEAAKSRFLRELKKRRAETHEQSQHPTDPVG